MKPKRHLMRGARIAAAIVSAVWISTAYALPIDPGDGTGDGTPAQQAAIACAARFAASLTASPSTIDLGGSTTLSWSVTVPPRCPMLDRLLLDGAPVSFVGAKTLQPMT